MTESDLGEREAARERQSHVRHELRAPLAGATAAGRRVLPAAIRSLDCMR